MEDDDFGVVDEAVDHGFDGGGVAEDVAEKDLLEETMRLARS